MHNDVGSDALWDGGDSGLVEPVLAGRFARPNDSRFTRAPNARTQRAVQRELRGESEAERPADAAVAVRFARRVRSHARELVHTHRAAAGDREPIGQIERRSRRQFGGRRRGFDLRIVKWKCRRHRREQQSAYDDEDDERFESHLISGHSQTSTIREKIDSRFRADLI